MIKINNLKKTFGETTACNIPSFTINDGDILGLVGNNGAGKTTLFRMILDLLKPDEGSVEINGINPAQSEEWKHLTGAFIDEGFLIDYLTPEEYFSFIGKISGIPQKEMEGKFALYEALAGGEVFGQKKLIRNLSAGNKQKVGIISALIREPQLVILDEPFNFLDPTTQNVLKRTLTQYAERTHATIIISSHNLQHTIDISNRIALLEKGVIIRDMTNEDGSARQELTDYFGE
ncbi:ABC transporter ATP-binding protein [Prevotella sp. E15-22]|jgi:ABC-2 type transport system ATP-binding protein|uniref:ABC transporter ATP-binding protein n=1 Tax=Prevotella sp. E15-22 TaxID=2937774 RepID=UPI00205AC973|nr:ABC transporter ATP-binding protein [Prevotella sp. E15-22]UPS45520.1 ABC transporter ATP-binding protein [Prevotella sp. E15-22]